MLIIFICFVALAAYSYVIAESYEKDSDDWKMAMAGCGVSAIIAFIYMVFVCCCWKNIALGASIMQAASQFVSSTKRVVAVPVISYILVIPVFLMWTFCAVHLYSIGEVTFVEGQLLPAIEWKKETEYIFWVYLFGLLWIMAYIIAVA